jgi:hypothetical protein
VIRVRSYSGRYALTGIDMRTGSLALAARDAVLRAEAHGHWDDVSVDLDDGSRPLRGVELRDWITRHFPEALR